MDVWHQEGRLSAPLEKLATISGDTWVGIAFSPVCKLAPAWIVGKRTLRDARRLVFPLQSAAALQASPVSHTINT
jgi:hypothetical protein